MSKKIFFFVDNVFRIVKDNNKLGSFDFFEILPLLRIDLIKLSVCLTDKFFLIIVLAKNKLFSKPTNILQWPCESLFYMIISFISFGKVKSLKELDTCDLLLPINFATFS